MKIIKNLYMSCLLLLLTELSPLNGMFGYPCCGKKADTQVEPNIPRKTAPSILDTQAPNTPTTKPSPNQMKYFTGECLNSDEIPFEELSNSDKVLYLRHLDGQQIEKEWFETKIAKMKKTQEELKKPNDQYYQLLLKSKTASNSTSGKTVSLTPFNEDEKAE